MDHKSKPVIIGISIILSSLCLGLFIFKGMKTFSDKDRYVTVKGLAEMDVMATSSVINLSFNFSGDNLDDLINNTKEKKNKILNYLSKNGIDKASVNETNLDINDRQKYYETRYRNGNDVLVKINRYTTRQMLSVVFKDVKNTENKSSKIKLGLISKDLTTNVYTNYIYPELNSIKPQLIAESTKNARVAGEQFANDSQAKLGKIKTASQGQISLNNGYDYNNSESSISNKPYIQKARVVSKIVFFLE